jgi:DNA processing protein
MVGFLWNFMSIYTNFNCYLINSFSSKERKIAIELLRKFRSSQKILSLTDFLASVDISIPEKVFSLFELIFYKKLDSCLEPILENTLNNNQNYISILDINYPESLLDLEQPPLILFIKTNNQEIKFPSLNQSVSIVGSRNASVDAIEATESLSEKCSRLGLSVVSGLASGIDTAAHCGAYKVNSTSTHIAVIANDVDYCFPSSSKKIYSKIIEHNGFIISEYPPGSSPLKHQFVARNRIIAALSKCTIVTQAKEKSGALHTARFAIEIGREVAVLPWSVVSNQAKGSNNLLRDGAIPILDSKDLELIYPDHVCKSRVTKNQIQEPNKYQNFIEQNNNRVSIEKFTFYFDLNPNEVLDLELEGTINIVGGYVSTRA